MLAVALIAATTQQKLQYLSILIIGVRGNSKLKEIHVV
jgi:hypothetical protein